MTNTQLKHEVILNKRGWEYVETGGGCDAYMLGQEDKIYALMGRLNDANIPDKTNEAIGINIYNGTIEDDNTPIASITCKLSDILTGKVKVEVYKV